MAYSSFSMMFYDYDKEPGTTRLQGAQMTDITLENPLITACHIAINAMTVGNWINDKRSYYVEVLSNAAAATKNAQRERKWKITGYDTVTYLAYKFEIPCGDEELLADTGEKGEIDYTSTEWLNLKAAVEAYALSNVGNAVVIEKAILVGRNT